MKGCFRQIARALACAHNNRAAKRRLRRRPSNHRFLQNFVVSEMFLATFKNMHRVYVQTTEHQATQAAKYGPFVHDLGVMKHHLPSGANARAQATINRP